MPRLELAEVARAVGGELIQGDAGTAVERYDIVPPYQDYLLRYVRSWPGR